MALITFYNASTTDKSRFKELLADTDHQYEFVDEPLSHKNLNSKSEVISIFVSDNITAEVIDALPNLKLIATRSTGFDHIDIGAAAQRGIPVVTVPRYGERTVAEYTFALLLALSRRIIATNDAVNAHRIDLEQLMGFDLSEKTFGIIGSGKIGQHAAEIARGFAMRVIAYDIFPDEAKAAELGFTYVPLEEIARQSDIISLHAPATPQTHHIVDEAFLGGVKSSAVLVNTARGELVDLAALTAALQSGRLAGAALDVFEHETLLTTAAPTDADTEAAAHIAALEAMEQVLITPHNAFNTQEAVDRIRQTTVRNIIDFYKGETPNKVKVS